MIAKVVIETSGQGLMAITREINQLVADNCSGDGLCTLFIRHTSASLLVQENYDISAQRDLEAWLNRLVPEGDALYSHTLEGADDMPAHINAMLTAVSIGIPIIDGQLALGVWQGVYLWEHRHGRQRREIIVHFSS
ncbi:secondary thiamine-phosphate synthase enzyme YjbQ [Simiduia curdlanivorans]|uniref:Secondary thiamine-phosphate synthase enzyme YjbQ n=1 Tax=Simiduia curdlanivorans TaxID=1492769 RepID=A0ABV8V7T2_9GAMM|nr:secondary thiamine-phosphate synthase enzyme YjbQ [Simiduia curdlanivorans]MDN3639714.1 secondary thiamine-phosphate synthase enzyme YjbQ [Simiduia curdlanivorans]